MSVIVTNGDRTDRSKFVKKLKAKLLYKNTPGVNEEKKVELFTKYWPHVRKEHQDDMRLQPSDEVMKRVKTKII